MANFNINKVIIGGHITAEPELKQTPSGTMVMSFSVAVNRRVQAKSESGQPAQTQADFINCVAWRERAEFIARYFHKGSSICIVGHLQTRTWTDGQGVKRYATEVLVDESYFVDSKADNGAALASTQAASPPLQGVQAAPNFEELGDEEELPF